MNSASYRVRRATLEDLGMLRPLWNSMRLPVDELERRLTEFQVVENTEGLVVGAIGVQIRQPQGRIHSEAYSDFAMADSARPLLWNRLQSLAMNHGVFRLWTQEDSPFWKRLGFRRPNPEELKKLPPEWRGPISNWLTLQLKDEDAIVSLEKELTLFMTEERQRTARTMKQAQTLKTVITVVGFVVGILLIGAAIYLYFKRYARHY